ncbi:MAG: recombinase family protein [Polyangiaceae bacterium]|jgi:DNA invertase Pin-like site-specific DNA recombinase
MTVAAYIRVSSRAQDHKSQKAAIERVAAERGDSPTFYAEKKSAKTLDRPVLGQLRADAKAGKFSKLYVFKLDRLARSGIRDTLATLDEFRAAGVKVVSVADGFDLDGPCADIIIAVMSWGAQMERNAIGERIAAARERVEAEGGSWGRPPTMTAAQVDTAKRMKAEGRSLRAIASAIGVPRMTIQRAVTRKAA